MDTLTVAPLRNLDDFILGSSRFQVPDLSNPEKWANRVVSNLLYYQTNYLLSAAIIFALVSYLHPQEMALGMVTVGILFGISLYLQQQKQEVKQFKKDHPAIVFCLIAVLSYYLIYKMGSIAVFLFGVTLPICFIVVHASLRLRNIKNKLANASEALGVGKVTLMSVILNEVGIEPDLKSL
jgi:Flp pilus assembly protein TadB